MLNTRQQPGLQHLEGCTVSLRHAALQEDTSAHLAD